MGSEAKLLLREAGERLAETALDGDIAAPPDIKADVLMKAAGLLYGSDALKGAAEPVQSGSKLRQRPPAHVQTPLPGEGAAADAEAEKGVDRALLREKGGLRRENDPPRCPVYRARYPLPPSLRRYPPLHPKVYGSKTPAAVIQ